VYPKRVAHLMRKAVRYWLTTMPKSPNAMRPLVSAGPLQAGIGSPAVSCPVELDSGLCRCFFSVSRAQQLLTKLASGRPAARVPASLDRKKTPDIIPLIEFLLEHDTAGDPITGLKWSAAPPRRSPWRGRFWHRGEPQYRSRLLHQMGYSLRVNHKQIPSDSSPDRNQQFLYISDLRHRFQRRGQPIVSIDTKKRELVQLQELRKALGFFATPGQ